MNALISRLIKLGYSVEFDPTLYDMHIMCSIRQSDTNRLMAQAVHIEDAETALIMALEKSLYVTLNEVLREWKQT